MIDVLKKTRWKLPATATAQATVHALIENALKKTVPQDCFLAFTSKSARSIYRPPLAAL